MSVTVLCPNGRRQSVKVTPNTSALEILEIVCEKQNFDSKEYTLFRNNKPIDLSLTIRFANIPNNGQLDLKEAPIKRTEQKVKVAIDLETGDRKIQEFESNDNLWHIIHTLYETNPVLDLQQNMELCIIYIGKEIVGEMQLKQTNLKGLGLTQGRAAMKLVVRHVNTVKGQAFVESLNLKKPLNPKLSSETEKPIVCENEKTFETKRLKQINNEIISESNEMTEHLTQELNQNQSKPELKSNVRNEKIIEIPVVTANSGQKSPEVQEMEVQSEESDDESQQIVNFLGDTNSEILFKRSDLPKVSKLDFPDDFYRTTKDDLVYVLNDLRKQQVGNNEKLLETKQMREKRRIERLMKYKSTVIRICFPNDGLVFQAIFKPNDTIRTVMQVVANYINPKEFYLYTVPPKHVLNPDSSLFEVDLVPAAVIHFGSKCCDSEEKAIKDEFKSKLSSYKSAAKISIDSRKTTTDTNPNSTQGLAVNAVPTPVIQNTRQQDMGSTKTDEKIPKWFKTNK